MKEKQQPAPQKYKRDYYEKFYANKLASLAEMNKFLKTCSLPKLNIEDIENMIRPVTSNKSESLIKKNCLKKKTTKI